MLSVASVDGSPAIDLAGRTVVITGANTGVGRATAEILASRGAQVVLACRSEERTAPVLAALPELGSARFLSLDLADLSSVRRAVATLSGTPIDVLINNAGVGGARGLTRDGFELAFGTNYLGHHLFTRLLLPQLGRGARIVHLGSGSHAHAPSIDFERVTRPTASLTGIPEYAVSKLAVMLFHRELAARLSRTRRAITSLVADPGDVASEAYRHLPWPVRSLWTRSMKSPAAGALTPVFCATEPRLPSGTYVDARPFAPSRGAQSDALAEELWMRSARWLDLDPELR